MQDFDFDYWKNLFTQSPGEFEVQRRAALQEVVDSSPPSHRPGLATMVDTLCAPQQGSPHERAANAQTLMFESLDYLKAAWLSLAEETGEGSAFERALLNAQIRLSPSILARIQDQSGRNHGFP